jgi:hypothetical protein
MRRVPAGALVLLLAAAARPGAAGETVVDEACTFQGHALHGRVQVVDAFADVKVKVVDAFPDLRVKKVDAFADSCGEWQLVDSFPDVKVKFVDAFADVKVTFVDAFPGRP